jgi:hypothetical protein
MDKSDCTSESISIDIFVNKRWLPADMFAEGFESELIRAPW